MRWISSCHAVCLLKLRGTAVTDIPSSYFPYSRQSKKKRHRAPITARMIANLLTVAGVDHVVTLDLHVGDLPAR